MERKIVMSEGEIGYVWLSIKIKYKTNPSYSHSLWNSAMCAGCSFKKRKNIYILYLIICVPQMRFERRIEYNLKK